MDKVINKVKKLLAMANGTAEGGEHERDTALKMAHNLLAKHNLSIGDLKEEEKEKRQIQEKEMTSHAWAKIVAISIAHLFFCEFFTQKVGTASQTRMKMTFIGLESNVLTARELTEYVIGSITKEAAKKAKAAGAAGGFQRSFCNGAAGQIASRCRVLRAEAEKSSEEAPTKAKGMYLVLASLYSTEKVANDQYILDVLRVRIKTKMLKPRSTTAAGYHEGADYGSKLPLNKQLKGA